MTIGGTEVAIQEWKSLKIRVTLPAADKPGASGDVIVKVREHESNPVPLTMWHVEFKYTDGPEQTITAYQRLYLDVYRRADVHRYRTVPDGEVHDQEGVKIEPAEGSSGRWKCDWSGTISVFSISTVNGEGELPFTREKGAVGFTSYAMLDPAARQVTNLEFELDFDDENTCVTESTGAGTTQTALGFVLLPSLLDEVSPDYPVTSPLILTEKWVLKGGKRDLTNDKQWPWLEWADAPGAPGPVKDKTPA